VAITDQDRTQIMGAAKALFQQKKAVNLDDLTDYLRSVVNVKLETADVEESLSRLFERQGANLPAIELHQCMLFRRSALAYWMADYAILVMEEIYISEPDEGEKEGSTRTHVYLFFGVAGDAEQTGKLLGMARSTKDVLDVLKSHGIEIGNWHPLDRGAWKRFIPYSSEKIDEFVGKFGKSMFGKSLGTTSSVIYAL
jgi:hypothetical protein